VAHWFGQTYREATSWASRTIDDTVGFFGRLPDRAFNALKGLGSAVLRATSGAGSWLYNVGIDIVVGLVNGIRGAWGWAVDSVKSFMSDILAGAKAAIASHSPSRKFADEVGRWIPHGVAAGVSEHAYIAQAAVAGLMNGLPTIGPTMGGATGGTNRPGGGVAFPGNRPGENGGGVVVEMRAASGDQVAEALLALLRPTVRGRYGGNVSVAMGGAA
jgi:phage-related protein